MLFVTLAVNLLRYFITVFSAAQYENDIITSPFRRKGRLCCSAPTLSGHHGAAVCPAASAPWALR